ncbi:NAD-dependent epimerase/dehydratase family protein [Mucilaginibacter terrenus]|uniref:NAD-dependent epimerase/dehydratase family protein n=1 Tax=Mucilaginibacter terrenus TaxID=2482727 RepID=A0A3E2NUX8_9SPHI|nr:NAD-dependent epimerase/dehydratase family protein [Mucilaginibacter terrenus]RFZ84814.1 NAD-dependent epimerase/dehydratase family protein [Mucilaginibacter terrenus]
MKYYLPEEDLQQILARTRNLWPLVAGKSILLTGGTGFFGKWITGAFIYINRELRLNAKLYILSRQPDKFLSTYPEFEDDAITFIKGDVTNFGFIFEKLDFIIHAATDANTAINNDNPALIFDTIVEGTRHILELAKDKKVKSVLLTSSGAVYGTQPVSVTHISEDDFFAPDVLASNAAYGEGKRVAEMLCAMYYQRYGIECKIARCFAFAGPHLPLNGRYALGNFIFNAINNQKITIVGDGSPYRSYLYAADLVIWLFTVLLNGRPNQAYNIGSDEEINILDLAGKINNLAEKKLQVDVKQVARNRDMPSRYVPSVEKAKNELGLKVYTDLDTTVKKTLEFYRTTTTNTIA